VLIVHAPTANINYDSKDNFYEKFEKVFDLFPTYHMQIRSTDKHFLSP
jgi:hypothetical protein